MIEVPRRGLRFATWAVVWAAMVSALFALPLPASAQEASSDVNAGTISGRVFDDATGSPLADATVVLTFPEVGENGQPKQKIATSGPDGDFEFEAVAAGQYGLSFIKSGYRVSSIPNFQVAGGQDNVANFPMPRVAAAAGPSGGGGSDVVQLDEFVVDFSVVGELMEGLELRLESDQLVNLLTAEDLSRYAASDVADALKRVAGVNVVEGQFAVVRGLEDRYSSTLFNGAPVPSPDPDSQSVQLDLFPSDVVTNLVVAKTFAANSPSNSAAGSINILTQDYPEELTFKLSLGAGFEEGALDRFLEFESGSTAGSDIQGEDLTETDFTGSLGGHFDLFGKDIRFKAVANHEVDYRTRQGTQEGRQPVLGVTQRLGGPNGITRVNRSGGLAFGELGLSDGLFEQTISQRSEQLTASFGAGIDLDDDGDHRVDFSAFYTKKDEETVELRENGYFSDLDYGPLIEAAIDGNREGINSLLEQIEGGRREAPNPIATPGSFLAGVARGLREQFTDSQGRGALFFNSFGRTSSFERQRDLQVYQFNGEHEFDILDGLDISWAANHALTNQEETSLGMRFFFEPCGFARPECPPGVSRAPIPERFPVRAEDLGPGNYFASGASGGVIFSETEIDETQWFGKIDFDQSYSPRPFADLNFKAGAWWERSRRSVESSFVENVTVGGFSQFALASPTLQELGSTLFDRFDPLQPRIGTNRSTREVTAGYLSLKATLWEDVDFVGGVRVEQILIDSENDPFTGELFAGRPSTFPPAYLFFDRVDTPEEGLRSRRPGASFNDEIVGVDVPIDPVTGLVDLLTREEILSVVTGEIDEVKVLPSIGVSYRPIEGLTLRGSYSQTVARPSLRELGYYVTIEPGTDDRFVGNPQLQLSDVKSVDFRTEYVFGDLGDLFAFSAFYKSIEDPIESIVLRNPLDFDSGSAALFNTPFNNQNTARLWGIEVEARKSFDFLDDLGLSFPGIEAFDYLSVGGNFTYIDARVKRSEAEISRAEVFFLVQDDEQPLFTGLRRERRLFGQPEWIANADISFDHPDWGTTVTLAFFAISDVLDAAGSVALGSDLIGRSLILDRYLDSFYQFDLVASQQIWGGLKAKVSIKNLTDTRRRRIFDQEQTNGKVVERNLQSGRDWSFSLSYTYEF